MFLNIRVSGYGGTLSSVKDQSKIDILLLLSISVCTNCWIPFGSRSFTLSLIYRVIHLLSKLRYLTLRPLTEEKKEVRKIFGFCSRDRRERTRRASFCIKIQFKIHSNFVQYTPPKRSECGGRWSGRLSEDLKDSQCEMLLLMHRTSESGQVRNKYLELRKTLGNCCATRFSFRKLKYSCIERYTVTVRQSL